jgi:uncharacterized membrane protein HdeD (DUF308 family)
MRFQDWKTTLVGFCQLVNGIVPAVQAFQVATAGHYNEAEAKQLAYALAWFFLINGILQQIKGIFSKDSGKGSDRPQEIVDEKLSHVPPADEGPKP